MGPWANPQSSIDRLPWQQGGPWALGSHGSHGHPKGRVAVTLIPGSREEAPWPPPLTSGFILVSFTGKFADILGLVG